MGHELFKSLIFSLNEPSVFGICLQAGYGHYITFLLLLKCVLLLEKHTFSDSA